MTFEDSCGYQSSELMRFFKYDHLKDERMKAVSKEFADLAFKMMGLKNHPEKVECLRNLLIAKDCAVRAMLVEVNHG